MKKGIGFLLIAILGMASCNNNKQKLSEDIANPDAKIEIGKINDFLKKYEEPSQTFTVLADKSTQVRGKEGTIIFINPKDIETETGESLGINIEIELKELLNQKQLLSANAQTTSNGKLLVSGGAYFINMTSDGKQLRLKTGKKLSVVFPKISSSNMYLFYGKKDSLGQMNWEQTKFMFENKPTPKIKSVENSVVMEDIDELDSIITNLKKDNKSLTVKEKNAIREKDKNDKLDEQIYKVISLTQLGWINCDRFYDFPNNTNLKYTFNKKDDIISANVYLVFNDINSVIQSEYFSFKDKEYNSGFQNIPLGAKTKIIVLSIKNGKTYTYKSDLTIKSNETIQIKLVETSQDQIDKLFKL